MPLAEEMEFTRASAALTMNRCAMPWRRMDKDYRFDSPACQLLDVTAIGRQQGDLPFPMRWVRLHDEYGA